MPSLGPSTPLALLLSGLLIVLVPAAQAHCGIDCLPPAPAIGPIEVEFPGEIMILGGGLPPVLVQWCLGEDYHARAEVYREGGVVVWTGSHAGQDGQRAGVVANACPERYD